MLFEKEGECRNWQSWNNNQLIFSCISDMKSKLVSIYRMELTSFCSTLLLPTLIVSNMLQIARSSIQLKVKKDR